MNKDNKEQGRKIKMTVSNPQNDSFVEEEQPLPKEKKKKPKKEKEDRNIINMTDIREARKKEKNKKRWKKLLLILIVIALGAAAYLTRDKWVYKLEGILDRKPEVIVNDGETQKGNFPISVNSGSSNVIYALDNNIICADDSGIYIYDESGEKTKSFVHNLTSPVVRVAGRRILAFDNGGNVLKVYNKTEELYSKTVDESILFAEICENGYTAIVTETEKYPSSMTVFDNNGSEIYRWSSGQRIMDISFNDSGSGCYITTFSSDDGIIQSVVHYVRFNSEEEKMKSEKLDTLVIDTFENNNGDIWAVGDDKFYKIDDKGRILLEYEYTDDLVSYSFNEYAAAIAVNGISKDSGYVAVFDSESEKTEPAIVQTENGLPKKLISNGRKTLLLSDRAVDAYDLRGNCVATVEASIDYTDFVYLNKSVYFLGYREINKTEFNN